VTAWLVNTTFFCPAELLGKLNLLQSEKGRLSENEQILR
jgi:hypothetical protein